VDVEKFSRINAQALRRLISAHATRLDEPLVLAVRFRHSDRDVHLLEVLEGFPAVPGEEPFETEFAPSAELLLVGKLHLTLVSPAQLASLIDNNAALAEALRADGTIEYYTMSAEPLIAALGLKARASSSEKKARQELLDELGVTVSPEEMDSIRKGWVS
jgi:hypothetical protein